MASNNVTNSCVWENARKERRIFRREATSTDYFFRPSVQSIHSCVCIHVWCKLMSNCFPVLYYFNVNNYYLIKLFSGSNHAKQKIFQSAFFMSKSYCFMKIGNKEALKEMWFWKRGFSFHFPWLYIAAQPITYKISMKMAMKKARVVNKRNPPSKKTEMRE